jgi:hypothetical protein
MTWMRFCFVLKKQEGNALTREAGQSVSQSPLVSPSLSFSTSKAINNQHLQLQRHSLFVQVCQDCVNFKIIPPHSRTRRWYRPCCAPRYLSNLPSVRSLSSSHIDLLSLGGPWTTISSACWSPQGTLLVGILVLYGVLALLSHFTTSSSAFPPWPLVGRRPLHLCWKTKGQAKYFSLQKAFRVLGQV